MTVRVAIVGDLHLGRTTRGLDRTDEVEAAWDLCVEEAEAEGCDVLIQTGDVFDGSAPAPELTATMIRMFHAAAGRFGLVCVCVGNHDLRHGRDRSDALAALRAHPTDGLVCAHVPTAVPVPGSPFDVLLLPYESRSRRGWDDPEGQDAVVVAALRSGARPGSRLLCVGHLDLDGVMPGSETAARGGGHQWPGGRGWGSRVALSVNGHYHRPQVVSHGAFDVHCVGTPVALDFGEAGEAKRWMMVTLASS